MQITYDMPLKDYIWLKGLSISRLKEIKRSPLHYKHSLTNMKRSKAMALGTAAHTAVLEPARFESQYAVWSERTDGGNMAPRRGSKWDSFCARHAGMTVITEDDQTDALAIQAAVRNSPAAMKYLASGHAEFTMHGDINGRKVKGRGDWLHFASSSNPTIVGLKTSRDCRPFMFGKQAAVLGYHQQWAWYHDLFRAATLGETPALKEIVVESAPPYAVAVYHITDDIIAQGREDYLALLSILLECEATDTWPGPVDGEEDLALPTWAYTQSPDDIADLGLEK